MAIVTTTLSSKGQLVIPKEIREELNWGPGTELAIVSGPSGITIRALPRKRGTKFIDLIGMLKHDGATLSTEDLCAPVDYGIGPDSDDGNRK